MALQQFERRLERLVEGIFARAFRSGLQPVEVGRRLAREMDLRRAVAPKGVLVPNDFTVSLSPRDRERFAPIEQELVSELVGVAREHSRTEGYTLLGPLEVRIETDEHLAPGTLFIAAEILTGEAEPRLVMPDGRAVMLDRDRIVVGRLPECDVVIADANVSRRHAEIKRSPDSEGWVVADLGSTNGTRLNGMRLGRARSLTDGDEIGIGGTTIRFEVA